MSLLVQDSGYEIYNIVTINDTQKYELVLRPSKDASLQLLLWMNWELSYFNQNIIAAILGNKLLFFTSLWYEEQSPKKHLNHCKIGKN